MASKNDNRRPFKVMLNEDAARSLSKTAALLQVQRDNYQIGIGSVVSEIVETLVASPALFSTVLELLLPEQERQAAESPPAQKKSMRGNRAA